MERFKSELRGLLLAIPMSAAAGVGVAYWLSPPGSAPTGEVLSIEAMSCQRPTDRLSRAGSVSAASPAATSGWQLGKANAALLGLATAPSANALAQQAVQPRSARPSSAAPASAPTSAQASTPASEAAADAVIIEFSGMLKLTAEGKPLRASEAAEAVVYWRPQVPAVLTPPPEALVMTTRRKVFLPRALPVMVGSQVRFPNEDPILHNAFSTAAGNAFDTGLYSAGEGETVTFPQAGLVRVYCNVHQAMVGHILVLDTPYFVRPDQAGRFNLKLPPGAGELFVWHERASLWRKRLSVEPYSTVDVVLDLSRRRVPAHLNKFGKPYRRGGSDYR